jgi:hypothetical protein
MDNDNKIIILKELERMEVSLDVMKKAIGTNDKVDFIKTEKELKNVIMDVAGSLTKSTNYTTINGLKNNLLNGNNVPNVKEAKMIQDKFKIPKYAWEDINWYKQSLKPAGKEE